MKRFILVALIVVITAGLIFASCAAPAPAPSPAPAPAPSPSPVPSPSPTVSPKPSPTTAPSPTASAKVFNLRYNDQNPAAGWEGTHAVPQWMEAVTKATNGRVKFTYYDAETLSKGINAWEATKNGIADVSWAFHGYWPGLTSLADVISLPFLSFKSAAQGSGILWQLYEKYPTLAAQYKDNKVLLTFTNTPYYLITTKKQVKTLDDLKGLKIRVIGGPPVDSMKALGGVPVTMGMPDTYINLQKGVIDGMGTVWESTSTFRLYEVVKYYTYVPLYMGYFSIIMNWDTWNSLPKDIQDQIMSNAGGIKGSTMWGANMFDSATKEGPALVKSKGFTMDEYTLPPDELAKWTDIGGKPLWDKWAADQTKAGRPEAKDILNTTLDLIKTYTP